MPRSQWRRCLFSHVVFPVALILLFVSPGTLLAQASASAVTLAHKSEARAVIVVGQDPGPVVRFAAGELTRKLNAITGADFQIVTHLPKDSPAIVLGDQPATRAAGIDVSELKRDGYVIRTSDQRIYIAGRDDRGEKAERLFDLLKDTAVADRSRATIRRQFNSATWDFQRATLFGAYDLLRRLGARWFYPGPAGEVLPDKPTLTVPALDVREEPAFEMRRLSVGIYRLDWWYADQVNDRPVYEALGWTAEAFRLFTIRQRESTKWIAFNHRPKRHQWEERFGKSNPEYFALQPDGTRDLSHIQQTSGHHGHLCYTHPGVFRETVDDINAFFTGESATSRGIDTGQSAYAMESNNGWHVYASYGDTFSLLPQDGFPGKVCQHDACQALTHPRAEYDARHNDLIWSFVDRVAREIKPRFPDKKLTCLAYTSYSQPPRRIEKLSDNVIVGVIPPGRLYTYATGQAQYEDTLRTWNNATAGPLLVWANDLYRHARPQRENVPMVLPNYYADMARMWREHNVKWVNIMTEQAEIFLYHLQRYVWYQLLWNPDADPDALIQDYVAKLYGLAAAPMGKLVNDVLDRSRQIIDTKAGQIDIWSNHFTEAKLKQYDRWMAEAKGRAANTPSARPVELFERHFLNDLRDGHAWYARNIRDVMDSGDASVAIRKAWTPITVDGKLDEKAWRLSDRVKPFHGNTSDKPTKWDTEARLLRTDDTLYFAFICHDPKASQRDVSGEGAAADNVEVFLDPQHDHDSYYQVMVDITGQVVEDNYRQVIGEPIDESWNSKAQAATQRLSDRWVVEIAVPRGSMQDGDVTPGAKRSGEAARPWGVNFCRTMSEPPRKADRFSCFSPLLRGRFHQPDLFAHMYFEDGGR